MPAQQQAVDVRCNWHLLSVRLEPIDIKEAIKMKVLLFAMLTCLTISLVGQNNIDNTKLYNFKVRLLELGPRPPDCGIMAWAIVQKFAIISTDYPNYKNKYVLIVEGCPEFLGKHFFKQNGLYKIKASTTGGGTTNFSYSDKYKKDDTPRFWSRQTIKDD